MVLALLPAAALASHAYPIEYKPLPSDCLYTPALCFQQASGQALILVLLSFRGCPSRSEPIRENQLDKAGNPVGIKSLIAAFVLSVLLPGMLVLAPLPSQHSLSFLHFQL